MCLPKAICKPSFDQGHKNSYFSSLHVKKQDTASEDHIG